MTTATTKSWGEAKAPESKSNRDIERLKVTDESKIRLVGDVLPRYVRWITTTEGGKRPVESLTFDRDKEDFIKTNKDPFNDIPEEVYGAGDQEKEQFSYVCNVLDRTDGKIKLFDLKRTVYAAIVGFANNPDYGNPADPNKGYDITVKKVKTGSLPQNVKYECLPARSDSPLTDEEKALELYDLPIIYKRPTYDDQRQWLMQNTSYFLSLEGDDFKPESPEDL